MEKDIILFIKELADKLGVTLTVYDALGNFLAGDHSDTEEISVPKDGVFTDINRKQTFFKVKTKAKEIIIKINGAGRTERNYAYLISELAENFSQKEAFNSKEEFFKALIQNEVSAMQTEKYKKKFSVSGKTFLVMQVSFLPSRAEEVMNVITNYAEAEDVVFCTDDCSCVFIRHLSEKKQEYSVTEFADIFVQAVYEETGVEIDVGIGGTVDEIEKLSESYAQALSAQKIAKTFNTKGQVHLYKDFILIKALENIPKSKLENFLKLMVNKNAKDIFNDKEMSETAEVFMENNLNISETSRKLYLHRNTLAYRLDKIERVTGLDIRKFSDALNFRLSLIIYSVLKEL